MEYKEDLDKLKEKYNSLFKVQSEGLDEFRKQQVLNQKTIETILDKSVAAALEAFRASMREDIQVVIHEELRSVEEKLKSHGKKYNPNSSIPIDSVVVEAKPSIFNRKKIESHQFELVSSFSDVGGEAQERITKEINPVYESIPSFFFEENLESGTTVFSTSADDDFVKRCGDSIDQKIVESCKRMKNFFEEKIINNNHIIDEFQQKIFLEMMCVDEIVERLDQKLTSARELIAEIIHKPLVEYSDNDEFTNLVADIDAEGNLISLPSTIFPEAQFQTDFPISNCVDEINMKSTAEFSYPLQSIFSNLGTSISAHVLEEELLYREIHPRVLIHTNLIHSNCYQSSTSLTRSIQFFSMKFDSSSSECIFSIFNSSHNIFDRGKDGIIPSNFSESLMLISNPSFGYQLIVWISYYLASWCVDDANFFSEIELLVLLPIHHHFYVQSYYTINQTLWFFSAGCLHTFDRVNDNWKRFASFLWDVNSGKIIFDVWVRLVWKYSEAAEDVDDGQLRVDIQLWLKAGCAMFYTTTFAQWWLPFLWLFVLNTFYGNAVLQLVLRQEGGSGGTVGCIVYSVLWLPRICLTTVTATPVAIGHGYDSAQQLLEIGKAQQWPSILQHSVCTSECADCSVVWLLENFLLSVAAQILSQLKLIPHGFAVPSLRSFGVFQTKFLLLLLHDLLCTDVVLQEFTKPMKSFSWPDYLSNVHNASLSSFLHFYKTLVYHWMFYHIQLGSFRSIQEFVLSAVVSMHFSSIELQSWSLGHCVWWFYRDPGKLVEDNRLSWKVGFALVHTATVLSSITWSTLVMQTLHFPLCYIQVGGGDDARLWSDGLEKGRLYLSCSLTSAKRNGFVMWQWCVKLVLLTPIPYSDYLMWKFKVRAMEFRPMVVLRCGATKPANEIDYGCTRMIFHSSLSTQYYFLVSFISAKIRCYTQFFLCERVIHLLLSVTIASLESQLMEFLRWQFKIFSTGFCNTGNAIWITLDFTSTGNNQVLGLLRGVLAQLRVLYGAAPTSIPTAMHAFPCPTTSTPVQRLGYTDYLRWKFKIGAINVLPPTVWVIIQSDQTKAYTQTVEGLFDIDVVPLSPLWGFWFFPSGMARRMWYKHEMVSQFSWQDNYFELHQRGFLLVHLPIPARNSS